jgi:hypothetical protein
MLIAAVAAYVTVYLTSSTVAATARRRPQPGVTAPGARMTDSPHIFLTNLLNETLRPKAGVSPLLKSPDAE